MLDGKVLKRTCSRLLPQRLNKAIKAEMARLYMTSGIELGSMLKIDSFAGFEMAYRQGTADELVLENSFDHDIFFSGVPEYQPCETDVIVDVGAHIGTFAILAASKVSRGAVYSIEACKESFDYLRINAALNQAKNLSIHRLAIYDRRGACTLHYDRGNWGHSVVCQFSERGETVDCCTLQQFFEENGISRCDFLKFNCEGAEFPTLLSSSAEALRRVRIMLVLYHCDLWTRNSQEDLVAHLQACGFDCKIRNRTEKRGWIIAVNPTWNG